MTQGVRIAIDVGGTFTDVVKLVPSTGELRFEKVPTIPHAPTQGVMNAFERAEATMGEIQMFNHGTTLGLNSLLTRTGARIALISTHGFRDVYLLGRTDRSVMYDIKYKKPRALLERYDTFEVIERCHFDGSASVVLDEKSAIDVARTIASRGYEAVAVSFLHAYANPDHEMRMREILSEYAPGVAVTLSHELSREYREYERTSTAVLDAYIKPKVRNYLKSLAEELAKAGFTERFLMTRSGGGAMTAAAAREQPVNLILSGPAGGVIGAAAFSKLIGSPNLITIDMGGTSLDASLILDHSPVSYQGAEFEGLPINTPSLNIQTIGAGGGSIAWLDEAQSLQVGPQSAGATPGPAAYGRGGLKPTFTDAALALGYLGTDSPLGGSLVLDSVLATRSLESIAQELQLSPLELARGILRISATKIMGAVRVITIELGLDPKDFALLSFGGGGGLVAVDVARELGIPSVIVPPGQGAFSALGMLMADVQHDFARTNVQPLEGIDLDEVERSYQAMEQDAEAALAADGFGPDNQRLIRTVDVRYVGQEHSVTMAYPSVEMALVDTVTSEFERLHARQYGHTMTDAVELTTLRLKAIGVIDKPSLPKGKVRGSGKLSKAGTRSVYAANDEGEPYALYVRETLMVGDKIVGPAIISEHTGTTVIHSGDMLSVGEHSEMVITVSSSYRGGQE